MSGPDPERLAEPNAWYAGVPPGSIRTGEQALRHILDGILRGEMPSDTEAERQAILWRFTGAADVLFLLGQVVDQQRYRAMVDELWQWLDARKSPT